MNKKLPNPLPENTPGQRILKLRLSAGLTQEQLAERLGFTANYFGQVERDAIGLSNNMAHAICRYFNVTFDYLYFGPHACGTMEKLGSLSENQAMLADFIKSCSEEECRMLEPIIKVFVRTLRDAGWFKNPNLSGNDNLPN